jgi:4-carboxymuconolactone decarboxylase
MKRLALPLACLCLITPSSAQAQQPNTPVSTEHTIMQNDLGRVAPALEKYAEGTLQGEVWKRAGLSTRDRSIVTLAALVARNQTIELPLYLNRALNNGVKASEISELITHLAFYSGWSNAMSAVAVTNEVFADRKIEPGQLPAASGALLPLNEAAEADRAKRVGDQFGAIFPGVAQYTTDVLFRELWLRPDLAPRDRSLVTISALVANGQVAQLTGHIPIGMNNGLTQGEIAEAITHLAFYVGWPNVFSAMPVAKDVFERRGK